MDQEGVAERERVRRVQATIAAKKSDNFQKVTHDQISAKNTVACNFGYFVVQPQGQKILVTPEELETFTAIGQHQIKFATTVSLTA